MGDTGDRYHFEETVMEQSELLMYTNEIPFTKMAGTGNDFILIDNRSGFLQGDISRLVRSMCARRVSVGADGLLLLEKSHIADFRMRYFNADGGEAEFCGNGARCMAWYAFHNSLAGEKMSFESETGLRQAVVDGDEVTIDMPAPCDIRLGFSLPDAAGQANFLRVGVPHTVICVEQVDAIDVRTAGHAVRNMDMFKPEGTNVNFVQVLGPGQLKVRTYERGVEDETYSCGTGVCASAVVAHLVHGIGVPVAVRIFTGEQLTVSFRFGDGEISDCRLTGKAKAVYRGTYHHDEED